MKFLWFVLAVVALGMAGLYGWYGSLHPCDMLMKDVVRARVASDADLMEVLRDVVAPVKMTPGECVQALAKLHISPNEFERLSREMGEKSDAASGRTKELQRLQDYQNLLNPPAKADTSAGDPGYNTRERDEMRRAIEGIGRSGEETQ